MLSLYLGGAYLFILLFKVMSARKYRKTFIFSNQKIPLDQVSILQPILSGDPKLPKTLESNLETLRGLTFFWLVDKSDAEAHRIADKLISAHADCAIIKLIYPEAPEGLNPKLFKLHQALPLCKTRYCLVLDDDTTLPLKTLQAMLGELKNYQLVTGLPKYREVNNFYSRLLAAFVNNNAATTYLSLLPYMKPITINGMCYGFNREYLQKIGGFQAMLTCLTDDLAVAESVLKNGGEIRQIPLTQTIETSILDLHHYIHQMHRWYVFANILFFKQSFKKKGIILALYGVTPLLLLATLTSILLNISHKSIFYLIVFLAFRQLALMKTSNSVPSIIISIFSECLQTLHLIHAFCSNKIRWRTRLYRVNSNSEFTSL